eukprot:3083582-Rhodomonas_salina.1
MITSWRRMCRDLWSLGAYHYVCLGLLSGAEGGEDRTDVQILPAESHDVRCVVWTSAQRREWRGRGESGEVRGGTDCTCRAEIEEREMEALQTLRGREEGREGEERAEKRARERAARETTERQMQ